MDVSIIIVNYNTKRLILACLESLFENTKDIDFEVFVSDNGSSDGSIEAIRTLFPRVKLIENKKNIGFGAGNNRALVHATGKYVFYLNSDTLLLNNAVKFFYDYWETFQDKEHLGAVGCLLQNSAGEYIHSGGAFPTYKYLIKFQSYLIGYHFVWGLLKFLHLQKIVFNIRMKYKKNKNNNIHVGDIDYVIGADLFMLNNENAKFDEDYFLYYEESDLQYKISKKNLRRILIDTPKIVHLEKKRAPDFPITSFASVQNQLSSYVYAKKNLSKHSFLLNILIRVDWLNPYIYKIAKPYFKKLIF